MRKAHKSAHRAFALTLLAIVVAWWASAATTPVIVRSADVAGTWNIAGVHDSGVSHGFVVLSGDTYCGTRSSGSDTVIFDDRRVDATGSGDTINFNNFFDSFTVMPSGSFQGFISTRCGTETSPLDTSAKVLDSAARAILRDTAPANSILGISGDTGAASVFVAIHKRANETMTMIVGVKQSSIESHPALGAPGRDTFIGFLILRDTGQGNGIVTGMVALARRSDTAIAIHEIRRGGTISDSAIGTLIETTGKGGQFLLRADTRSAQMIGSNIVFRDTLAIFRTAFSSDSRFVTLIEDTSPSQADTARHRQFMGAMLRPDSRLETSALFGAWRTALTKPYWPAPGRGAIRAITGHFEFRGNGSGVFIDGGGPGAGFSDTSVSYVVATDAHSGIFPQSLDYFRVTFRPDSGSAVTARFYVDDSGRKIVIAGATTADSIAGIAMRPPNASEKRMTFGVADSVVDQPGLGITVRVDTPATAGALTLLVSPFDAQTMVIRGFRYFLNAEHVLQGFDTVFAAFSIAPNTTVLAFDSIVITVDVRGSSEETGGGANLYVLVYDETAGVWTRLTSTSVDTQSAGLISFRLPHFSLVGLANVGASGSSSDRGFSCLILRAASSGAFFVSPVFARKLRESMLECAAGRSMVSAYYSGAGLVALLVTASISFMIPRKRSTFSVGSEDAER